MKAVEAAKKVAAKEVRKKQPQLLKKNGKKSPTVVPQYKKPRDLSTKVVKFAEENNMIEEEEVPILGQTKTRKINLPTRYKTN